MSRQHRGAGSTPARRTPLTHLLFGRARAEARARVLLSIALATAAGIGFFLAPQRNLHAPVIDVVEGDAPVLVLENLTAVISEATTSMEPLFEPVDAALAGLDPRGLEEAVEAVRHDIRAGAMPGAALVVGRGSRVVEKRGLGSLGGGLDSVHPDETLYDLASLTKVVATTAAVMLLVEDGRMALDAPVRTYLPEFASGEKSRVTIQQLLTHTSGLPAGVDLPRGTPEASLRRLLATPLKSLPGEKVVYSDIGPIILFMAAERAAGEPVEELLRRRIYEPLGMKSTRFNPGDCSRCAPTTTTIRGHVHDPIAQRLGGVAGNAGLFSTASDVGRFAAMLAGGGRLEGVRIFSEQTIRKFTARQRGAETRALGWDTPGLERSEGSGGVLISDLAFGHTGFTGTSLWVDPDRGTWTVLLSNRTYTPRAPNRMQALRRTVNDRVAEAADMAVAD
jgi:CubicO group peptidase (beta-lactamase class C family)